MFLRVGDLFILLSLSQLALVVSNEAVESTCTFDNNGNPDKGCAVNSDLSSLLQGKVKANAMEDAVVEDDDEEEDLEEVDADEDDEDYSGILEHSMLVNDEESIADADTDDEFIYDPVAEGESVMRADDVLSLADQLDSGEHAQKSKEYTSDHFDCSDELILRMAMSVSLEAPVQNLVQCEKWAWDNRMEEWERLAAGKSGSGGSGKKKAGSGGSGKNKTGSGSGGSGGGGDYELIRDIEGKLSRCQQARSHQVSLGPRLVRMTGHDAADYKNTVWANGSKVTGDEGGVDACLHSALISQGLNQVQDQETEGEEGDVDKMAKEEEELIKGDANHNRGLGNAVAWVISFASASQLSRPDVEVLGATVYLEAWADSHELGFRVGRSTGQCSQPVCLSEACWSPNTQFFAASAGVPVGSGAFCPYTNSLTPLRNVLGLTVAEFVALQGAHSVGGIMMCSGMGDISSGPFCPSSTCSFPPVMGSRKGYDVRGLGFGGTSFDSTPGTLDNEYYKQLMNEKYEILVDCSRLEKPFPHIQRGGSGGGGPVIVRGETADCKSSGTKSIACKKRYRYHENSTSKDNWPGVFSGPDAENTCSDGLSYMNEDQCDTGTCAENCMTTQVCKDSQNVLNSDEGALGKAWIGCNACKLKCKSSLPKKDPNCIVTCRKTKKSESKACKKAHKKKAAGKTCKKAAAAKKSLCEAACSAVPGADSPKKKINWCKTLPAFKVCSDPRYTTGNRRGANNCGTCPADKCFPGVNLGGGRGAGIKSVNRWATYRGVVKRVMVLPSDWSYLKDPAMRTNWMKYANDNNLFLNTFATAWKKTTEKGKEKVLKKCKAVVCTTSADGITCPVEAAGGNVKRYVGHQKVKHGTKAGEGANSGMSSTMTDYARPAELVFKKENCKFHGAVPTTGKCHFVGAVGVRAKLLCDGNKEGHCCSEHRGCQHLKDIEQEWKEGGGKGGTCSLPKMPALDKAASAHKKFASRK